MPPEGPKNGDIPLDHVERPQPPWRRLHLTECGLPANSYPTITREELARRHKKQGLQRTAMTVCMPCLTAAQRWPTWGEDPIAALGRETARTKDKARFRDELLAIALLIQEHKDEFDSIVEDIDHTIRLANHRHQGRVSGHE